MFLTLRALSLIVASTLLLGTTFAQTRLLAIDSSRVLYSIDRTNGAKTVIGTVFGTPTPATTGALAYDRRNNVVYLSSTSADALFKLDLGTLETTQIGPYGDTAIVMHGMEYDDSTGTLYGMSSHNAGLYRIDVNTGTAILVGTGTTGGFQNLGYNPCNNTMYMTHGGQDNTWTIDVLTNDRTLIGSLLGSTNPNGLAFDRFSQEMFLIDNSTDNLYKLNLATGEGVLVGSTGSGNLLGLIIIGTPDITGDITGDGCIDDIDLAIVLEAFGSEGPCMRADVNYDDIVDDADLAIILSNFGNGC
ncbi:MAG: hypothetical protein HUU60_08675 [Armatimonadetes bacterium]|nr:hypothetical protein [Armatimonadota bacterium]